MHCNDTLTLTHAEFLLSIAFISAWHTYMYFVSSLIKLIKLIKHPIIKSGHPKFSKIKILSFNLKLQSATCN